MNKEFVTYKTALALKELGFDDLCLFYYADNEALRIYHQSDIEEDLVAAPLYQQAFRWFREKHNLWIEIHVEDNVKLGEQRYYWTIFGEYKSLEGNSWIRSKKDSNGVMYNTYEEAQDACLDKLIELVKNDNTNK